MNKPVVVLCGGLGTRLNYPGQKCMVPVAGRPFLHHKVQQLIDLGATELHLLVAYRHEDIRAYFYDCADIPIYYHQDDQLGRVGAYRQARPFLPKTHWLTYGDCLLDAPLAWRPWSYTYTNSEFLQDAGMSFCLRGLPPLAPRYTRSPSLHINSPADLEKTSLALVHRLSQPR